MFNVNSNLSKFYNDHVRLSGDEKQNLREYRDTNIERVKAGLARLGHPGPVYDWNQGSYAISTINKSLDQDYVYVVKRFGQTGRGINGDFPLV